MTGLVYRLFALLLFFCLLPFFGVLYLFVVIDSNGGFLFLQRRIGKNKKPFTLYKIRTMIANAENLKKKYKHLNETTGPVFKIRNDPRYTRIGKWLSHTGLDEMPQLINVIKGEMTFVGPRPLPPEEAKKIPKKYEIRFDLKPGITSSWIIRGAHKLSFEQWMRLDLEDAKHKSVWYDFKIFASTVALIVKLVVKKIV